MINSQISSHTTVTREDKLLGEFQHTKKICWWLGRVDKLGQHCIIVLLTCRLFREKDGLPYLTRLSRSRQHTTKVVFAANKVCTKHLSTFISHTAQMCQVFMHRIWAPSLKEVLPYSALSMQMQSKCAMECNVWFLPETAHILHALPFFTILSHCHEQNWFLVPSLLSWQGCVKHYG